MDLIDKRDEVLRIFLEYGITENTENDLTKTDLAECAEQIVKKLIIGGVMCSKNVLNEYYTAHNMYHTMMKETEPLSRQYFEAYGRREGFRNAIEILTGEEM